MLKLSLSAISITTGLLTTLVVNCAATQDALAAGLSPFAQSQGASIAAPWRFVGLPERYAKPYSEFDVVELEGKKVLRVRTDKSYGNLVHDWAAPVETLKLRWRLDSALLKANLKSKKTEDLALKVCLSFDMPTDNIPSSERTLFKFAQFFSRDKLPTATLCYVWAHAETVGTEQASPYTGRVRYIVVNSGEAALKTWQDHTRNVRVDFARAFGTESVVFPAVTAIIVGADSDNTEGTSLGYVADIQVMP